MKTLKNRSKIYCRLLQFYFPPFQTIQFSIHQSRYHSYNRLQPTTNVESERVLAKRHLVVSTLLLIQVTTELLSWGA
jgi:hypothetical protein